MIWPNALVRGRPSLPGVALRIVTSSDTEPRREGPDAVIWPNALVRVRPAEAPVPVERFTAANLPGWLRGWASGLVQRARQRRQRTRGLGLGYSYFDTGFHEVEHWKSGFAFRWTGAVAHLQVDRPEGRDVVLELYAPGIANMDVLVNGQKTITIALKPGMWQNVELPLTASGVARYELRTRPTFVPRGETRRLGVAVRSVTVRTRKGQDLPIPFDRERDALLGALDTFRLAEQHDADGQAWGRWASGWDMLLKGPFSLRMARAAIRAARECDLVLVADTPYLASAYGWLAARRARKPLVALPFFALRDPEHHRPWTRFVMQRADLVLSQDAETVRFAQERWRRPAALVGPGFDAAELDDPAIDGRRFRAKHTLDGSPLALMLAPKSASSAYRVFCAAAAEARRGGSTGQFVLAGHDEDGLPMPGPDVRYLGPLRGDDWRDALDACDVLVVPSTQEPTAIAVLKGWMRGKPVIGSFDAQPVAELVDNEEDGLLFRRPEELAAALRRLLDDADLRARLGARGRAKAAERFSWDHLGARIDDLLHAVAVGPKK